VSWQDDDSNEKYLPSLGLPNECLDGLGVTSSVECQENLDEYNSLTTIDKSDLFSFDSPKGSVYKFCKVNDVKEEIIPIIISPSHIYDYVDESSIVEDFVLSNEMTCSDIFSNSNSILCEGYIVFSKPPIYDTYEYDLSISSHNLELGNNQLIIINLQSCCYFISINTNEYDEHIDINNLTSPCDGEYVHVDHMVQQEDYTTDMMVVNLLNFIPIFLF